MIALVSADCSALGPFCTTSADQKELVSGELVTRGRGEPRGPSSGASPVFP